MTSMKRNTLIAGMLGMTLLSGCTNPVPSMIPGQDAANLSDTDARALDLVVLASGNAPAAVWTKSDIEHYLVYLTDSTGQDVLAPIKLEQTGSSRANKAKFENLRLGQTYTATIWAMKGGKKLNEAQTDNSVTFEFGNQDVKDLIERSVTIKLDSAPFSGTMTIPLTKQFFKDVFKKEEFDDSSKVTIQIQRANGGELQTFIYDRPLESPSKYDPYKNYQLTNLHYGVEYVVTLTNHYFKDSKKNNEKTEIATSKRFKPFSEPPTNTYTLKKSDF